MFIKIWIEKFICVDQKCKIFFRIRIFQFLLIKFFSRAYVSIISSGTLSYKNTYLLFTKFILNKHVFPLNMEKYCSLMKHEIYLEFLALIFVYLYYTKIYKVLYFENFFETICTCANNYFLNVEDILTISIRLLNVQHFCSKNFIHLLHKKLGIDK